MKKHLGELLTVTVSKCYGEFYASVFGQIAHAGRASLSTLIRTAGRSPVHTRSALAVLLKQQLILSFTDDNGVIFYEPHWDNAYYFTVRAGSLVQLVEERHGKEVADVFGTILTSGVITVEDLVDQTHFELTQVEKAIHRATEGLRGDAETNGAYKSKVDGLEDDKYDSPLSQRSLSLKDADVNGSTTGTNNEVQLAQQKIVLEANMKKIKPAVQLLLKAGLVEHLGVRHFMSDHDIQREAEEKVMTTQYSGGLSGKQVKYDYACSVDNLRRHWKDESLTFAQGKEVQGRGFKRARSSDEGDEIDMFPSGKRQKTNGHLSNGVGNHDVHLDNKLLLRVNFEKCNVCMRTQQLVRMATRYVGEATAKIYEAILLVVEASTLRCYDPFDPYGRGVPPPPPKKEKGAPPEKSRPPKLTDPDKFVKLIKIHEIIGMLDADLDLDVGLANQDLTNGVNGHVDEDEGGTSPIMQKRKIVSAQERMLKVEQHLKILAVDPRGFVAAHGRDWKVPVNALTKILTSTAIEDHVTARYGRFPASIIRFLSTTGNVDEVQVTTLMMMQQKEIQEAFYTLQKEGFLIPQEVPKDNTRQANRLSWMSKYDELHMRTQLIDRIYKAMTRCLQRIDVEKRKVAVVVEKSERTDVVGNEAKYLSEEEKDTLKRWYGIEDTLLRQVSRMDEFVAVLRDFSALKAPPPTQEAYP